MGAWPRPGGAPGPPRHCPPQPPPQPPPPQALASFYAKYQSEPLVLLKWLTLAAGSNLPGNVAAVEALVEHPAFNINNPNNCYSLFLGFAR